MFKSARRQAVEQELQTVINLHHNGKPPEFIASAFSYSLEYVKAAVIVNDDQPTYLRRLLEEIQRKSVPMQDDWQPPSQTSAGC
jgi:hypothetical protein